MEDIKIRPARSSQYQPRQRYITLPDRVADGRGAKPAKKPKRGYSKWQRLFVVPFALVMLANVVSPFIDLRWQQNRYELSEAILNLIGPAAKELTPKLSFNQEQNSYIYNANYQPEANTKTVGGGQYEAAMPIDAKQGIAVTDPQSKLSLTMVPKFDVMAAKQVKDRIVYPLKGDASQLVYSLKADGVQEDLVLPRYQGDAQKFTYELKLPNGTEARLLDNGDIGIYSADPLLFGNITTGTDADKARLEKARQNGAKTNLAFTIPAPLIYQANNNHSKTDLAPKAKFELSGNTLTVNATHLKNAQYPLTIDPSVSVASASTFTNGNNEGNISFDTSNNLIRRSAVTGGTVSAWTATSGTSNLATARRSNMGAVYNGYIYVYGGCNAGCSTAYNTLEYAQLSSVDGSVGAWATNSNNLPANMYSAGSFAYNGYLYIIGGCTTTCSVTSTYYAKINSDHTVSTWTSGSTLLTGRSDNAAAAVGGFAYTMGGCTSASWCSTVTAGGEYAPIKADGSLGTWVATTASLAHVKMRMAVTAYNGSIYTFGGCTANQATSYTDAQRAVISSTGDITSWVTINLLPGAAQQLGAVASNGYLYILSGNNTTNVYYAAILGDGSLGAWQTTKSLNSVHDIGSYASYNGYIYATAGCNSGSGCTTITATTDYGAIAPAGEVLQGAAVTGAGVGNRYANGATAYEGYLWVAGGCSASPCSSSDASNGYLTTVKYAVINGDGTIGTWSAATSITATGTDRAGRMGLQLTAYRGYLYVIGGIARNSGNTADSYKNDVMYIQIASTGAGTTGSWAASANTFTNGRQQFGAAAFNGYLYIAGGLTTGSACAGVSNYCADVQYAPIGNAGDLSGAFSAGTSFTTARSSLAVAVNAGYLYVVGGFDGTNYLKDVQVSALASNGSNGAFSALANFGSLGRRDLLVAVNNSCLYVMGGYDGTNFVTTIYYAQLNPNTGALVGSWNTDVSALVNARSQTVGVAYDGYLYEPAGLDVAGGNGRSDVDYGLINNGGRGIVPAWNTQTPTGTSSIVKNTTVAANGYLYVIGGCTNLNCTTSVATVESFPINSDGSLGTGSAATSLPAARGQLASGYYNGYIYIMGGSTNSLSATQDVYYTQVASGGTLQAPPGCGASVWCGGTTAYQFATARYKLAGVAHNGYLYIAGGCASGSGLTCSTIQSDTQYAAINSNGSLSSNTCGTSTTWCATTSLNTGASAMGSAAEAGYWYLVNGTTAAGNFNSIVQYAAFNSNGTLGTWKQSGSQTNYATTNDGVVALNGYIYAIGGSINSTTTIARVEFAPILANGDIGPWQTTSALGSPRDDFSPAVYNGVVYVPCGDNSGALNSNVYYVTPHPINRAGYYSKLSDTDLDVTPTKIVTRGSGLASFDLSINYSAGTSSGLTLLAQTVLTGVSFGVPTAVTASTGGIDRYWWFQFVIDDSRAASFPDSQSTITGYDFYYHPNVAKRLRGGKTFTGQTQQSLDASP